MKSDFPIFSNNPDLIYLDSASTTQKPQSVIDAVDFYVTRHNSNLGRWQYDIALRSEDIYQQSKIKIAKLINAKAKNIIYTPGTTHGYNMITTSLVESNILNPWDKIMLPIAEHHANLLPRLYIAKKYNLQIIYIQIDKYGQIDIDDFCAKYTHDVKIISLSTASNVLGIINFPIIKKIKQYVSTKTILIADASQTLGHIYTDVADLGIDIMIRWWHKMMAYTGIWCIYMTDDLLSKLTPPILGGGIIEQVDLGGYKLLGWSDWREAGSPNMIGAVSIGAAVDYIDSIWWYEYIYDHDQKFVKYRFDNYNLGKINAKMLYEYRDDIPRLAIFAININNRPKNQLSIWHKLLEQNICVRTGWHCAQPLHEVMNQNRWTVRISPYLYNQISDLDKIIKIINS